MCGVCGVLRGVVLCTTIYSGAQRTAHSRRCDEAHWPYAQLFSYSGAQPTMRRGALAHCPLSAGRRAPLFICFCFPAARRRRRRPRTQNATRKPSSPLSLPTYRTRTEITIFRSKPHLGPNRAITKFQKRGGPEDDQTFSIDFLSWVGRFAGASPVVTGHVHRSILGPDGKSPLLRCQNGQYPPQTPSLA